jgi:hypothetical protein
MKAKMMAWGIIRLHLVILLLVRYLVAYLVARHWNIPVQDALLGILLFSVSWCDTQLYFHLTSPRAKTLLAQNSKHNPLSAQKEISTHDKKFLQSAVRTL